MSKGGSTELRLPLVKVTPLLFGALPLAAALGPLAAVYRGVFAYRLMCAFVIVHAVLFLLSRSRWQLADVMLAAAAVSFGLSGTVGLFFVEAASENPYSEFLAIMLGLLTALAMRCWQRVDTNIHLHLAKGWVMAGLFSCAIAAYEVQTGTHLPGYVVDAAPDPAATFGNPNALAMFLVMANLWAIPVRRVGGPLWRALTYILVFATPVVLELTGARLAMLVWLVLTGMAVWAHIRGSRTAVAHLAAAVLPLAVLSAFLVMAARVVGYAQEAGTVGTSGGLRVALTMQGLKFSLERIGLPSGPGAFESMMASMGDPEKTFGLVNAHNTWVEILVQYGLFSLLAILGFLGAVVFRATWLKIEARVAVFTLLAMGVVNSSSLDDSSFWLCVITLAAFGRAVHDPSPTMSVTPQEERLCT